MLEFVKVVATMLSIIGGVWIVIGATIQFCSTKVSHFILGEIAFMASIACAFLVATEVNEFALYGFVGWFVIGSLSFVIAIWPRIAIWC